MTEYLALDVDLGARSYPIWIGSGLLADASRWRQAIDGRHVLVVSNQTIAPHYLDRVLRGLDGIHCASVLLEDGERFKNLDSVQRVFDAMAKLGATRDATILALGGGVVGDLAGFAAACWMRGVDFVQMPTSLLAMVDASVGGKTAVNLPAGKNLVGAFHQPRAVVIDTGTLATLPDHELRAGLSEAVKHAALGDAPFFARLQTMAPDLIQRDHAALVETIAHACRFKAAVVARDETEQGERALLNFGHTFGHALETETGYGTLLHGAAVAIGMVLAARLSQRLGLAETRDTEQLASLLRAFGLPISVPGGLDSDALLGHMRLDKKNLGDRLRLVLWRGIGRAELFDDIAESDVLAVLR